jgi:hypothetical protein
VSDRRADFPPVEGEKSQECLVHFKILRQNNRHTRKVVLFEARHSMPRGNRLQRFPVDYRVNTHAPRAARKARHLKTRCLFSSVVTQTDGKDAVEMCAAIYSVIT